MAKKDEKQVKLQPKYRELSNSRKIVSELKVSGVWLEAAGFKAGEQVIITVKEKELIITSF
jgi:hypothetical protein